MQKLYSGKGVSTGMLNDVLFFHIEVSVQSCSARGYWLRSILCFRGLGCRQDAFLLSLQPGQPVYQGPSGCIADDVRKRQKPLE